MTPQHRFIDRDDLIKFLKFAGFDIELTERTDTVEELAISGFDDTGDVYYFELSHPAHSPSELAATAYQAGIECGREEGAAQAREDLLDALARDWKGRYVEDAVAEIRRFPESLRSEVKKV